MSVAITLVTYNPTPKTFERLLNVSNLGFDIFVYDNTDSDKKKFLKPDGVQLISHGKNIGLSKAMNVVFKMAFKHGHDWAIFFDQDTVFNEKTINHIQNFIKYNDVSIKNYFCIQFSDDLGYVGDSYIIDDRPIIINSGTAFNLKNLKNIGWMNEKYFVDLIDYEVCFRAKLKG